MPWPESIIIGHLVWKLEHATKDGLQAISKSKPGTIDFGLTLLEEQRIVIREDLSAENFLDTLLHEILHAMHFSYGWPSRMTEENFCAMLPGAFLRLALDNPELVGFLKKTLK